MNDDFENDATDNANFGKLAYGIERLRTVLDILVRWMNDGNFSAAATDTFSPAEHRAISSAFFAKHSTSAATTAKFSYFLDQFYCLEAAVSQAASHGSVEGLDSNLEAMRTGHNTLADLAEELNYDGNSGASLRRFAV